MSDIEALPESHASAFDRFDPRARLLVTFAAVLAVISLGRFPAQLSAFLSALSLTWAVGMLNLPLLRRLLALEGFMVVVVATLPFTVDGQPIWQVGPLTMSHEGLETAAGIVLKANAVVLLLGGLLGSLSPVAMGHALARLGIPDKLVHMLLFTVRYIDVIYRELGRSRRALRARGFVPRADRHTWRTFGWLIGMLLVRSAERAERVVAAMHCRGFTGRLFLLDDLRWQVGDTRFCVAAAALIAMLLGIGQVR